MEKVWGELKKIDAQAEQIRNESQQGSKEITSLAQKQSEKLLADSQKYAQEEAQQLYDNAVSEANHNREQQLKANAASMKKLVQQAEKRIPKASVAIVNSVLGET